MAKDDIKSLYDGLISKGYTTSDLGDENTFREKMQDKNNRKELYDYVSGRNDFRIGDYDSYEKRLSSNYAPFQSNSGNETRNNRQAYETNVQRPVVESVQPVDNTQQSVDSPGMAALYEQLQSIKPKNPTLRELVETESHTSDATPNQLPDFTLPSDNTQVQNGFRRQAELQGQLQRINENALEERRINQQYIPKKEYTEQGDIYQNYANRFSNTERGKQLGNELANINQEVSSKYADEYLNSPEYKQLASQYIGEELERRANEQFEQMYGERIQSDMEPYQRAYSQEVMNRYGGDIEGESNDFIKKQVGGQLNELSTRVNDMISQRGKELEDESSGKWWRDLPRGGGGAVTTVNFASNQGRNFDPTYQQLQAASSLIDNSQNIIDEASKKGNTNFVAGLGRGIRDSFNADNWTFGLTELSKNMNLNQVLDKADKGEKLTDSEQALLDALVTNMAVNAYYSSDLGRGYQAGQTTGASIPFMLEFAVNPVSASGSGIAKSILRYGARRFGLAGTRGAARKAALSGARLVGDAAAAAAMTGTTGLPGVLADTQQRMMGDVNPVFKEEGRAEYGGRQNQQGLGEAIGKSVASRFLENQSEMVFNAFPGIGNRIAEAIPGGMPSIIQRFGQTRIGQSVRDLYKGLKNNELVRDIAQRTQFHGLGEEYLEEVYNNFANIPLGDMTFEDAISLDQNINTLLGLAPTSVAFSMLGLVGLARERYNNRKNMQRIFGRMTSDQQRMFNELQEMSRQNGNDDIKRFIKATIEDPELTTEQKKEEIQYAWEIARNNAIEDVQEEETQEQVDAENADIDAHTDPKNGLYTEMDRIVVNEKGEQVRVPGYKTGEIGGSPVWVSEGAEITPANTVVLKPGEWDESTVRSMPADEVKSENEAMIREDVQARAEQESTYSPDIPPLQVGLTFSDGTDRYEVIQQNPDGGWIAQKTSVDEKGKETQSIVPIDEQSYRNIAQANIDMQESAQQAANSSESERGNIKPYSVNDEAVNNVTIDEFLQTGPYNREYYEEHPERMVSEVNRIAGITADHLNGKLSDRDYLLALRYTDSWLNSVSDDVIAEEARQVSAKYVPFLNQPASENATEQPVQTDSVSINNDLSGNGQGNAVSPSVEQSNVEQSVQPVVEQSVEQPVQEQAQQEQATIPVDEKGNFLYYRAPVDVTLQSIADEQLEPEEVDAFIAANQAEADKNLKKIQDKAPKMGTSIAVYKKAKSEWQEKVADAQAQSDYWKQVKDELTAIRTRPGDTTAQDIAQLGEPLNGDELAAMMLGNGSLPLLRESYMKELGAGNREAQGMFGLFASRDKGGMTIEEAGERLMEADRENGTNFFDQNDPNAGRNAIIDVLSSAKTKGDLTGFIRSNRERLAEQERQAEYAAYEQWCEENFHMTPEEYESYIERMERENPFEGIEISELDAIFAEAAEEYQNYLNEQNNGRETEETGNAERGNDVLSEEQSDNEGGNSEVSGTGTAAETGSEVAGNDEVAQGGESEEVDENGYPFLLASDGTTIFGNIIEETGLKAAPIKLSKGFNNVDSKGGNHGYGLSHIEASHGEQIRNAGFNSPIDFIETVAKNYQTIKKGNSRNGEDTYLLEVSDGKNNTLFIELSSDGTYWNVNSAGIFRESYSKKKEVIWSLPAFEKTSTAESLGVQGAADSSNPMSGNSPQITSSVNKDSENNSNNQTNNEFVAPERQEGENILDYAERVVKYKEIDDARKEVETNPTEAQKEAGNYKKGHVNLDGYDITIENPRGSTRSGVDANGQPWSVTMNNDYGYIKGTEGVDGDHIDVFLSDDPTTGNVYVVDQVNSDGSFDEHKVMYGFSSADKARDAYLANYSPEWKGLGAISEVSKDEFKKWINSSHRKTKPFAEYKSVKVEGAQNEGTRIESTNALYSIEPAQYTTKRGKVLDMHLVKFAEPLSKEQQRAAKEMAKSAKGWYDAKQDGFMMRSEESAKELADTILNNSEAVEDAQPVSMDDVKSVNDGDIAFSEPKPAKEESDGGYKTVWQYNVSVDKATGRTTVTRDDVSGPVPVGDARFRVSTETPEEMLEILRNPQNGMQELLDDIGVIIENKIKTRNLDREIKEQAKPANPSGNRLVTDERYEELKKRMRAKLGGQMNMGIDPEILAIGTEMAVYHIEKGARKFAEYAKAMIADLGDAIRPYLKAFYNGARDLPEVQESGYTSEMDSYDDVSRFDVANFDKDTPNIIEAAETISKEQEVEQQAEVAKERIAKKRTSSKRGKQNKSLSLPENDLFNQTDIDNEQRSTEPDSSVGNEARQEAGRTEQRGTDRGVHGNNESDTDRSGRVSRPASERKSSVTRNQNNYRFGENGIQVPSGEIAKLKANVEAIRTLKELEASGQPATDKQKEILSKYVGWGGLANALDTEKYDRRDSYLKDSSWNSKYLPYYEQLQELLTPEEFQSAIQSTTTSHYTPSDVIKALWNIVERSGFKGGVVSEPALGVGHIIGMMPESISKQSRISGYEIDSLSGRIASKLYPDADIKVQGYETNFAPQSKDLVITNVPFGKNAPYDKNLDRTLRRQLGNAYNLHNYFIAKGLLELKEGGIGVFVTSSATMDGADSRFREFVSGNNIDMIGAIRLPNDAFQKNAGTSVTADILVFRKRKTGEPSNGINFISTTQIGEGKYEEDGDMHTKPIMVNEYFAEHPEMMLGEMMTAFDAGSGGLYSGASQTLKPKAGADLNKELDEAIDKLPTDFIGKHAEQASNRVEETLSTNLRNGTITTQNGKIYVSSNGELIPVDAKSTFTFNGKERKTADAVNDYNSLKDTLRRLIHAEQTEDKDPKELRKELNEKYDSFVEKYGTLNRNKALDDVFAEDYEHNLPLSLEDVKRVPSATGKSMVFQVTKGKGILDKRVSYPVKEPTKAENLQDAVNISLSYKGVLDVPYISKLMGVSEEQVTQEMLEKGEAYRDPVTGSIVDKDSYLSGNVREKLEEARSAAENNPEYQKNVDDLAEVQPETIRFGDISYRLGTPWIPTDFINDFALNVLGIANAGVQFEPLLNEFVLSKRARIDDFAKAGLYKTGRVDTIDLFNAALNQRKPKIYDERTTYGPTGKSTERIPNEAETQAASEKIMEISDKFIEYIDGKTAIHRELERIYNDRYNNYRLKKYSLPSFSHTETDKDGNKVMVTRYPGASANYSMREHQAKAIQRSLHESTLLAHQVGTGKTFTMITTAMEMRRLGLARKPMIVVQNATLEDFVKDFYRLYPSANVLAPSKDERSSENRKRLFNLIATGDFDAIVIPQSFLAFIPDDEGRKAELVQKRIEDYVEAISRTEDYALQRRLQKEMQNLQASLEGNDKKAKKSTVKQRANAAERAKSRTERILDRRTDDVMTFEKMGIDALFIDEAHNFKKIGFATKMNNVKGVDSGASQRANSLLLKARWVQEKNGGRNVILATGTPITNTMAEVWTMMNFVSPDILEAYNIQSFDDFATTFGTVEPSLEFTATGNFKIADRFKSYVNVPELLKAFRSHADVVLTEDVKEFKQSKNIPRLAGDKMENVVIDKNEDLEDVMQMLVKELEDYNKLSGKAKREKSALPLVVFTKAKQAAIDLRLLNPNYADNPNSKTNQVVSNIIKYYKESTPDKGTQLVFCDSYQSPGEKPKMDLFDYDPNVPRFNLYEDMKQKLIAAGIPEKEIAIVNNYDGERRKALFEKVRNGDVRVLLGSTEKMGVGVNVQDRLFALHHVDAPMRPMDFEQRNGRILRQGNLYATWDKPVHVLTYGVQGTLDATAYDRLRVKQEFINQMMKGNTDSRVMEEQDDEDPSGMTFSQMAATLSGDKTAQLLFAAQNKLKRLRNSKRSDANSKSSMVESITYANARIKDLQANEKVFEKASEVIDKHFPEGIKKVSVNGTSFTEKFGSSLDTVIDDYDNSYSLNRGIGPLKISLNDGAAEVIVHFNEGRMVYELYAGKEHIVENRQFNGGKGLMSSLDYQIESVKKNLADVRDNIEAQQKKIDGLEKAINAPWGREEELKEAEQEVEKLQKRLEEKAKENTKGSKKDDVRYRFIVEQGASRLETEEEVNRRFNEELEKFTLETADNFIFDLGIPSSQLIAAGVSNRPIRLHGSKVAKKMKKHGFSHNELQNLPKAIANPIAVFNNTERKGNRSILTELKTANGNFLVSIDLGKGTEADFDIVSSIFGKKNNSVVSWINKGYATYINKEKALNYLHLAAPIAAASDNQELVSATNIVKNFENPQIQEENLRTGEGSLTDDELSLANDPLVKLTRRTNRTKAQRRAFAERERKRMVERVQELADSLHLDNVDIVTDTSTLEGMRKRAKGFYSRSTGRITIVIPNQSSVFDAEQTLLHEAVAHYGLRQLFGEHFDTFLENVYRNADEEIRRKIVGLAQRNGWDIATATEEYLASLAEETNFDDISASWWNKIKMLFLRMLHKIGFKDFDGVTLSDNELRYILWRSYENLKEPGRYRSILGEAADIAKQNELKVGNYAPGAEGIGNVADDNLYRRIPENEETDDGSRDAYNKVVSGNRFKAQEAYQDSMLSLKRLQEVVAKYSGKPIQSFENAYMAENQMSSKNTSEKETYGEKFFKPMVKSVGELMKKGASYGAIVDYVIAKHGLERNVTFAYRDAELQAQKRFADKYAELEILNNNGVLSEEEYQNRKDKLDSDRETYYNDRVSKNLENDYSGLTALAEKHGSEDDFKTHAEKVVSEFESLFDTSDLWDKINAATKETLRKAYESGMMSRDAYNKVRDQFMYYIPLRGWDETTAEDVYEYINSETSPVNSVLKSAKGRHSLADDPFATIGNMAESSIHQGNRNLMKQSFLNMAINHPTDVVTVKEAWYVQNPTSGDWSISFPDIQDGDSADVIADKVEEHEERMKELEKYGQATKVKDGLNIDYRIGARQAREHVVNVKRNGKDYLVFVNGNPRAAQAVNGLTNPDVEQNKVFQVIGRFNRELAANFTNRNPAFVLSNLSRDLIFSITAVNVKENPKYASRFARNIPRAMAVIARNLRGKGNTNNADDKLFQEFLENGGETGYTIMHSVDEYKKMVKRELSKKEITGKTDYFKAVRACAQFFSIMNRWAEDVSRFTTYMTSRQMGRPITQSVNDAKEITVNFNKRGAAAKTSGVFGWSAGIFKNLYLFFNAGVQSLANFGRLAKNNRKAFLTALGGFTAAGFAVPVLNAIAISLFGDDDDDYYGNLPEWVRKNNLCLYIPGTKGKFITIPLPIELRAFYGLGEMAYQETVGNEESNPGQIAYKAVNQITELLPLNPLGNNGDIVATIMPDVLSPIWQAYENKDFTGKPIYRKNAFNENMPEWTKAYNSTADWLVDLSEWTNEIAGGDKYKRGELPMSNWNPAIVEHLFESYFGGMAKTINQTAKTLGGGVESVLTGKKSDDLQWYSTPVLNRFMNDAGDDRSSFTKINQRYYKLYDLYEEVGKNLRGYSNEVAKGNLDYLDKLQDLYRSDDYKRYLIFKNNNKLIERIRKVEKKLPEESTEAREKIQKDLNKIKKGIVDKVEELVP